MCNCHSILECCVMFSGVKLSIRSFNLLHQFTSMEFTEVINNGDSLTYTTRMDPK